MTKVVVEIPKTSKNDAGLRKLQRVINKDLKDSGIKISNLYKTKSGDYGWDFNDTLGNSQLALLGKVFKNHVVGGGGRIG